MDKLLPQYYKSYGMYVNHSRSFPLDVDGCKPIERRVLLSAYQIANEKFVKSARVDGHCLGHFSPHGSSYTTIVNMVKQNFLEGQGNFGSKIGVEPTNAAASRYTEIKLSKKMKKLAFDLINFVNWEDSELDREPVHLPVMYPLCLLGQEYTIGIGFGYRTFIPCYEMKDLYARLLWLLGKTKEKPSISPITDCDILAGKENLEQLLTTGKAKIEVKGKYLKDDKAFQVLLRSWPSVNKFETILKRLNDELESGDIAYTDISSNGQTRILFEVIKQRNKEAIYKNMISKIDSAVVGNLSFEIIVVDFQKNVKIASVDEMLLNTFKKYGEITQVMMNTKILELENLKNEFNVLEKIRPYLKKYLSMDNIEEVVEKLTKEADVDEEILRHILNKYMIKRLFTIKTDISKIEGSINEYRSNLAGLPEYLLAKYSE